MTALPSIYTELDLLNFMFCNKDEKMDENLIMWYFFNGEALVEK
jgi:hypothetical protein